VARAMAAGATSTAATSAAATALTTAMNNLSPAGQRFAKFVKNTLQPRLKQLKFAVQEALLPPLKTAITRALPLLDVIEKGMVGTGKVIGGLAIDLAKLITGPAFKKDVGKIMASNNRAMGNFGKAGLAIVDILRRIAVVAGPILVEPFARWARALAESANASKRLTKSRIADFLTRAKNTAKTLGSILRDVAVALYNIGRLARPSGDTMLGSLAASAEAFRKATEDPANAERIRRFFENTVPIMQQFGDLLNRIGLLFARFGEITGGGTLDGLFWILNRILDVLEAITSIPGGGAALAAILTLSGVGLGLGLVAKGLGSIVTNVARLAKYTGVTKLLGAIAGTKAGAAVAGALGSLPGRAGGAVKKGASAAASGVKRGAQAATGAVARGGASVASTVAGSAIGQAAAAGLSKAGGAAKGAATATAGFVAQLARAGAAAIVGGLSSVATAIGTAAAAAWRGVAAAGALALGYMRVAAAAALSALRQVAMAVAMGVVRAATIIWTGVQWALNAALNANPIGVIVLAIAALVAGVIWAYNNVKWFRDGVDAAFKFIGQVASWLWNSAIKPAFEAIRDFVVNTLGPRLIWFQANVVEPAFRAIGAAASWLWNNAIKPAFGAIRDFLVNTLAPRVLWFHTNIVEPIFKAIGAVISWLWNSVVKPVFNFWKNAIQTVIAPAISWLWKNVIQPAFKGIGAAISAAWTGVIKPIFDLLKKGIDLVGKGFEVGSRMIRDAWAKIKEYAKAPAKFVIETVLNNGILAAWNKLADFFNLSPKGLKITLPKGFASGGIYPGYTPGKDIGLAAVSGGEAIMRPEWTRAVGPGYVDAMNRLARTGGVSGLRRALAGGAPFMGGFASGGIVEGIKSFFGKAKDLFVGGVRKAANSFVNPLLNAIETRMGGSTFAKALTALPRRAIAGFLDWLEGREGDFGGDALGVVKAATKYIGVGDRGRANDNIFNDQWGFGAGTPWCANFVSTAVKDAKAGKQYAGYPTAAVYGYWSRMKKVSTAHAKPGDLGVYGGPTGHINIIEKPIGAGGLQTIGGNENSVVRRATRPGAYAVLRPNYARGGVVDRKVFAEKNLGYDHDKQDPLYRLLSRLNPSVAMRVSNALAEAKWMNRDSGGPLYPGFNLVDNSSGGMEWVLTPEAVRLLGGPQAVQALNERARLTQAGRAGRAGLTARTTTASAPTTPTVNVFPQPGQSEHEIGMVAARKLGTMLR
jgi:hypothetical protein